MDSTAFLAHLRNELNTFSSFLTSDLSVPIEHCGSWNLFDLAEHLGGRNLWAAVAISEKRGDYKAPAPPRDRDLLIRWFDEASATLLKALDTDSAAKAWTFHPPHTVGFWQRRRCHEALIHRWDAEHALGSPQPFDRELATDGVSEVFDTLAPREIARGRAQPPKQAIHLQAVDTGASWTYGPGAAVATLTAPAETLLLMLWGRVPSNDPAITWTGDELAALGVLKGPLAG
jgi:uncharacterized protein (TIGR03083 family)